MVEKKYAIDGLIGWELSEIEVKTDYIELTFTKPHWYRQKLRIQSEDYDNSINAIMDSFYVVVAGEKQE
jgi:hypothetical protein